MAQSETISKQVTPITSITAETVTTVAVIVPLLNERDNLPTLVQQLKELCADQVVIVDGGSDDGSWQWLKDNVANKSGWQCLQSNKSGRANQMNFGAANCQTDVLLFLHADTTLPDDAVNLVRNTLSVKCNDQSIKEAWGFFPVRFLEHDWRMRIIVWFMNKRSQLTSVSTGDQVQFVSRELFASIGGFQEIELMEDIALSKALKKITLPTVMHQPVETSARRWLQAGVFRTVLLMWSLRLAYFLGVAPDKLASFYRQVR